MNIINGIKIISNAIINIIVTYNVLSFISSFIASNRSISIMIISSLLISYSTYNG